MDWQLIFLDMKLENYTVRTMNRFPDAGMTGRKRITTVVREITVDNVREVLEKALAVHAINAREIAYLWDVYRGKQDIRNKKKYVRENINEKICVNIANEIVTFKTAYLLNEPIQYISNGEGEKASESIRKLNDFMRAEDKESKDKEIVDWMHIAGVAERFVITDEMADEEYGSPYYVETYDPREAFVIYSASMRKQPMAGVILQLDENEKWFATVYTDKKAFDVTVDKVTEHDHVLGGIPLIEYENNMARMGAFEVVLSILNGINNLESDALDAIKDFVNGFDVFQNCTIDDGTYSSLALGGKAVKVKTITPGMEAKVYRVASELSQSGLQQRVDDLTEKYLTICGMPNRNGGSSTSDTGQAVIFRDGWSEAESRAKDTEKLFIRSERRFLRIVLNICDAKSPLGLTIKDVGINFQRKSLNNLQSRFQCLCEALANEKIHPESAFNAFGDMFGDKTLAYQKGMEWYNKTKAEQEESLDKQLELERQAIANKKNPDEELEDEDEE